jgi:hypothetical protein
MAIWYKLAYAAATLSEEHIVGLHRPLAYLRAVALLWITAARRKNEIARLRVGCVRRDWDSAMLNEAGEPIPQQGSEVCYLHVPPNKTRGAFWIWIPSYTADAIEAWERERPVNQGAQLDKKDNSVVEFLFRFKNGGLGADFLNRTLIPLLCRVAGVPEQDARGPLTSHRGRSTRATLLLLLGVSLSDIAAYLGHRNDHTVRHYARTNDTKLANTIRHADERMRLVDGLIDTNAAREGRPNVFFFLGRGADGHPRYCGNPLWSSCAHRLACQKCAMYVGGTEAELLEVREGVLAFQSKVTMTPVEQAATDGDIARLDERLAELREIAPPDPPSPDFVFNNRAASVELIMPLPLIRDAYSSASLDEQLARVEQQLREAEQQGHRQSLIRSLRNQRTGLLAKRDQLTASPSTEPEEQL